MEVSFSSHVVVQEDVLVRGIEDESIILNLNNESYYGLNASGTRIWDVLAASPTIQDAYDRLLAEYDVTPETLRTDLNELILVLRQQGLIELREPDLE